MRTQQNFFTKYQINKKQKIEMENIIQDHKHFKNKINNLSLNTRYNLKQSKHDKYKYFIQPKVINQKKKIQIKKQSLSVQSTRKSNHGSKTPDLSTLLIRNDTQNVLANSRLHSQWHFNLNNYINQMQNCIKQEEFIQKYKKIQQRTFKNPKQNIHKLKKSIKLYSSNRIEQFIHPKKINSNISTILLINKPINSLTQGTQLLSIYGFLEGQIIKLIKINTIFFYYVQLLIEYKNGLLLHSASNIIINLYQLDLILQKQYYVNQPIYTIVIKQGLYASEEVNLIQPLIYQNAGLIEQILNRFMCKVYKYLTQVNKINIKQKKIWIRDCVGRLSYINLLKLLEQNQQFEQIKENFSKKDDNQKEN